MRRVRFLLLLAVLATASLGCFGAAAAQAAGPAPVFAAKAAAQPKASAAAKGDGSSAIESGEKIGDILTSWGAALLLGVAGLKGLSALFKSNIAEGLTLLVIVVIIGGFIFAPDQVRGFIESVWSPIGG